MIELQTDLRQLKRAVRLLRGVEGGVERALADALNRGAITMRRYTAPEIRAQYAVPTRRVRETLLVAHASPTRLESALVSKGPRESLSATYGGRQVKKGATVKVKKSGGRKLIPGAFVATVWAIPKKSKLNTAPVPHTGVFIRRVLGGKRVPRLPIEELRGPAVPQTARNPEVKQAIQAHGRDRVNQRLKRNVDFLAKRFGAK